MVLPPAEHRALAGAAGKVPLPALKTHEHRRTGHPLPDDIFYLLAQTLSFSAWPRAQRQQTLAALACASRRVRSAVVPLLFREVCWPQRRMVDEKGALLFFPEGVWRHFRCVRRFVVMVLRYAGGRGPSDGRRRAGRVGYAGCGSARAIS